MINFENANSATLEVVNSNMRLNRSNINELFENENVKIFITKVVASDAFIKLHVVYDGDISQSNEVKYTNNFMDSGFLWKHLERDLEGNDIVVDNTPRFRYKLIG